MNEGWNSRLGVFDLETTGVDIETARIVQAHVGVLDPSGVVVEQHDWLIDPGIEIPAAAAAVHGITTERARAEGRPAAQGVAEIVQALAGLFARDIPVTIYNAPYDLSLLDREAKRYGIAPLELNGAIIDPLVIDKAVDRYRRGKRTLDVSTGVYGVELAAAHDAGADAVAAGRLALAIFRAHAGALPGDARALHERQVSWYAEQAENFEAYMRRERDPEFTADRSWPIR